MAHMKQKVALVIGGSGGIGQAAALEFGAGGEGTFVATDIDDAGCEVRLGR